MRIEDYRDRNLKLEDRFGTNFIVRAVAREGDRAYILYYVPMTGKEYLEEIISFGGTLIKTSSKFELRWIENDADWLRIMQELAKAGITTVEADNDE